MRAVRILEKPTTITWDYDEEADVLYLSIGEPQPAVGVDIGEGVILRYDEARKEVVGLTVRLSSRRSLDRAAGTAAEGPGRQPLNRRYLDTVNKTDAAHGG